jgi:hypothetical protein
MITKNNIDTPQGWIKRFIRHRPASIRGQVSYGYIDVCHMGKDIDIKGKCLTDPHELIKFALQNNLGIYIGTKVEDGKIKWYPTSSTNTELRKHHVDYKWTRVIFDWGSDEEMRQEEHELLKRYRKNYKESFYNKNDGRPGTKKINSKLINEIKTEVNWLRTGNYEGKKFKHLSIDCLRNPKIVSEIDKWTKVQTRDESINRLNVNRIKDRIDIEGGKPSDKAKAVVVLVNRYYAEPGEKREFHRVLIISGNHTIQAYMEFDNYKDTSTLPYVVIPKEVEDKLSDVEIEELSNDFNEDVELQERFNKQTAVKSILSHIARNQSWGTPEMTANFVNRGLTRNEIKWAYNEVELKLGNANFINNGGMIPDYRETGRERWMIDQESKKYQDGDTFISIYSLSAIKPNNVWKNFTIENENRVAKGLAPLKKIKVIGYYTKDNHLKTWKGTIENPRGLKWEFDNLFKHMVKSGELSEQIEYHIMPRQIKSVVHSELKEKWEKSQMKTFDELFESVS